MAKGSRSEKPWERQPNESQKAYEALYLYLQMGENRSLHKVEAELHKSHTLIARWSSRWSWVQRAREYDEELRRQELSAKKAEIKKMQTRQMQTALLLQKKAVEALNKIELDSIFAKDIVKFIEVGAKIERELMMLDEAEAEKKDGTGASLADTIVSAYKRRVEENG